MHTEDWDRYWFYSFLYICYANALDFVCRIFIYGIHVSMSLHILWKPVIKAITIILIIIIIISIIFVIVIAVIVIIKSIIIIMIIIIVIIIIIIITSL